MSLYRRSKTAPYYYRFEFNGVEYRASTKTRNREIAERIEREARRDLELGTAGLQRPASAPTFEKAVQAFMDVKRPTWSPQTLRFHESNLKHLLPVFGKKHLAHITDVQIATYKAERIKAGAANRTVEMEMATLRPVLKRHGFWAALLPHVTQLKVPKTKGKVLPKEVAVAVFEACKKSRSRALYPFILLAATTGSRTGTIYKLKWENIDFFAKCLTWGEDKTDAGSGRTIPLSPAAYDCLLAWSRNFPNRKPEHFVFPSEMVGASGHKFGKATVSFVPYNTDPTKPIGSLKTAWTNARIEAHRVLTGNPVETRPVPFRLHDYRHTAYTQMRNKHVPLDKIADTLGWSPSQMVRMASIYGHFTTEDLREAVDAIGYD